MINGGRRAVVTGLSWRHRRAGKFTRQLLKILKDWWGRPLHVSSSILSDRFPAFQRPGINKGWRIQRETMNTWIIVNLFKKPLLPRLIEFQAEITIDEKMLSLYPASLWTGMIILTKCNDFRFYQYPLFGTPFWKESAPILRDSITLEVKLAMFNVLPFFIVRPSLWGWLPRPPWNRPVRPAVVRPKGSDSIHGAGPLVRFPLQRRRRSAGGHVPRVAVARPDAQLPPRLQRQRRVHPRPVPVPLRVRRRWLQWK